MSVMCGSVDEMLRLIALNGYAVWSAVLMAHCPAGRELFDRMRQPQPEDLVLETTTIHQWKNTPGAHPGEALGVLIRIADEQMPGADEGVLERVYYVEPLDLQLGEYVGGRRQVRWTNASFIRIES